MKASLSDLRALAERGRTICRDLGESVREPRNGAPWFDIFNADDNERAELWIYGMVGDDLDPDDVTAGDFARRLRDITAPEIDLHINSPGGLVFDGVAIYTALKEHPATINVTVDGLAASAASFIAMAGDEVAVHKPAKMMIHDAGGLTIGTAQDHQDMADLLDSLSNTIAEIYQDRAGGTVEQWRQRMRDETWFSATQAVESKLADRMIGEESNKAHPPKPKASPTPTPSPKPQTSTSAREPRSKVHAAAWNNLNREEVTMNIEEILAAMKGIIDGAEGRSLTDEEVKRYESLESDLAAKRTEALRERQHNYESPAPSNVQNAVHTGGQRKSEEDTLEKAFNHYLRTGKENQDIADLRVTNAQSTTGTEGGFTVPEGFRQKLVDRLVAFGGLANEAEVITTDSGNRLPWPTLDDTANEGAIATEGSDPPAGSGADLVFGERELNSFKYVAPGANDLPLRVSVELLQDSAFDIEALVVRKLGERIARAQASDWVVGTGTGEPEGITQSGGPNQNFAAPAPAKDELIDALHSVDPAYRSEGVWVFNDAQLAEVRKLDDANGRPLWLPLEASGMTNAPGGVLLGHRVVIDQAFASPTAGGGETWGVFGDIGEGYVIRRVRDVQLVVNPYSRANQGQIEYTVWARADGAIQNPNSFVTLSEDGVA